MTSADAPPPPPVDLAEPPEASQETDESTDELAGLDLAEADIAAIEAETAIADAEVSAPSALDQAEADIAAIEAETPIADAEVAAPSALDQAEADIAAIDAESEIAAAETPQVEAPPSELLADELPPQDVVDPVSDEGTANLVEMPVQQPVSEELAADPVEAPPEEVSTDGVVDAPAGVTTGVRSEQLDESDNGGQVAGQGEPREPGGDEEGRDVLDDGAVDAEELKPVVIGEDMLGKVIPAAEAFEAEYYRGLSAEEAGLPEGSPELKEARSTHNYEWINDRMAEGRRFIDVGPEGPMSPSDVGRANYPNPTGDAYAFELDWTSEYQNIIRPWSDMRTYPGMP